MPRVQRFLRFSGGIRPSPRVGGRAIWALGSVRRSRGDRRWAVGSGDRRPVGLGASRRAGVAGLSPRWNDQLSFQDRLRASTTLAVRHGQLERALAAEYSDDREAHTKGKADMVRARLGGAHFI